VSQGNGVVSFRVLTSSTMSAETTLLLLPRTLLDRI
jgi:hypothetical protein